MHQVQRAPRGSGPHTEGRSHGGRFRRWLVYYAVVAVTPLELERPVVLLTSDPDDLNRLVEEPHRPKAERITVIHV